MMAVHEQLTPLFHELGPSWQRVQVFFLEMVLPDFTCAITDIVFSATAL
jgi:hypothetical protein